MVVVVMMVVVMMVVVVVGGCWWWVLSCGHFFPFRPSFPSPLDDKPEKDNAPPLTPIHFLPHHDDTQQAASEASTLSTLTSPTEGPLGSGGAGVLMPAGGLKRSLVRWVDGMPLMSNRGVGLWVDGGWIAGLVGWGGGVGWMGCVDDRGWLRRSRGKRCLLVGASVFGWMGCLDEC